MPESYLENALLKLSRQLVAFDEASLMDLWERYAEAVREFEPTRRWEEAALVFGLIQAVRMKNQLFNYNLSASRQPVAPPPGLEMLDLTAPQTSANGAGSNGGRASAQAERADQSGAGQRAGDRAPGRASVRQGKPKAGKLIPLRRSED
ncbi:MAG TPA: hypothetical protein VN419_10970 [Humidesulfovibrio sp.]|uniref:hypothetical protein n=1 Tax=Humidesulfovibrio sp. TaxID=2910988 RepID=UPI002BE2082E|nr:hypothetical protein [Humidesulfovibrio sp.]HWR04529.1 hypothetical protein [Humidesulfovibrio sp.]